MTPQEFPWGARVVRVRYGRRADMTATLIKPRWEMRTWADFGYPFRDPQARFAYAVSNDPSNHAIHVDDIVSAEVLHD
jgi:hypothetical protein